ncbi:DUF2326 domain-containing protein [Secundilactobacillus similis DSM 23365 = JCM 2765]|uniref:DUF2326 domain-containing protein n=1 Tax=Secundilactobacillus similis TaxID=414682 RepID=UPI00071025CB|nr:DUF2326 domain-containing protein [Secundilactobacillus similis]
MPGSERKKYIYTDYETQSENVKLKNFIETSKVRAELTLSDTLDSKGKNDVVLGVDLFPRGRKYIDSVAYKAKDYTSYLNQLLFNNENDAPTFRQLIGMFVRINMKRDTNGFLHFLDEHVSNDLYLLVYSFLFELSTPEITNSVYSAQNESKNLSNQLKNFKKLNNIRSQDAIKQKIGLLVEEINDIQKQLDGLVDSKRFIENQEKVNEIKVAYARLNDAIDAADYQIQVNQETLNNSLTQRKNQLDMDSLEELYEDSKKQLVNVQKTFAELVSFNSQLLTNKIHFFEKLITKWTTKKHELELQRHQLFEQHKSLIMLIQDDKIEEYTNLQNRLGENQQELGKNRQIFKTIEDLEINQKRVETELSKLLDQQRDASSQIMTFNKFFTAYSKQLNGDEYMLYKSDSGFPLDIELKNPRGLSTGTKKALIAAFDLAYQQFAQSIDKTVPRFIVHDVLETLDSIAFNGIIDLATKLNVQFVVAVLKNRIESLDEFNSSSISLTLTENDSLFGI